MNTIKISLFEHRLKISDTITCDQTQGAFWIANGSVHCNENIFGEGDGFFPNSKQLAAETDCGFLQFQIGVASKNNKAKLLLEAEFPWPEGEAILRLDRVTFPPGAIAYRHIHAGAGIRYLTKGALEIVSDDHGEQMLQGSSWFEDVNSAVTANASKTQETQFVRALVLPIEYEGKSTIRFLNQEDFDKPKLQKNHRFFDQRIRIE